MRRIKDVPSAQRTLKNLIRSTKKINLKKVVDKKKLSDNIGNAVRENELIERIAETPKGNLFSAKFTIKVR